MSFLSNGFRFHDNDDHDEEKHSATQRRVSSDPGVDTGVSSF
ncbi:hypothetical protein M6B38_162180 [Iris pallida]|uniref:Uncharacterized protein n=1 Tax=Iris pallida TaxID=29817 RepID=A0AAX6EZT7_IRIPA|nr:hypothetical protein M6B38_162180 [Iris pallida]